jgi:glycerophosphoryl diester phosphodiesterase
MRVNAAMITLSAAIFSVAMLHSVAVCAGPLLLVAHRGVVTESITENSLAALEEAIRRGYTHIEVDIRCTRDGRPVCLHDAGLKRTTGVDARIHEVTLEELRELVDSDTVPSLEEFCTRAAGRIELMPDIKDCPPDLREAFGESIRRVLTAHGLMERALFIGRKDYVNPGPGEGRVSTFAPIDEMRRRAAADPEFAKKHVVFGHAVDFNTENVKGYQALGLQVIVSINTFHYTRGDPVQQGLDDVQRMLALGVDGLQIDSVYDASLVDE